VLDTSCSYDGGASELLVGDAIHRVVSDGAASREELVVVTKVGVVTGELLAEAQSDGALSVRRFRSFSHPLYVHHQVYQS
jgi:aryl-alcohol dehydrogenase-like predicted oxidoreductase